MASGNLTHNNKIEEAIGFKLDHIQYLLKKLKKSYFLKKSNKDLDSFKCKRIPPISFELFIKRFSLLGSISEEVFLYSFILFERAMLVEQALKSPESSHKLLTVCIFVSQKYLDDEDGWSLEEFSKLGGIKKQDLENLEVILLCQILDFNISVDGEIFSATKQYVLQFLETKNLKKRYRGDKLRKKTKTF